MGLFKKRKSNLSKIDKNKKIQGCKYNFFTLLIIILVLIISFAYSCSENEFNWLSNVNSNNFQLVEEKDLNLVWAVNKTNQDNLKIKLNYSGLTDPANEITPLTIASENNNPIHDLRLNFDEVGYLSNVAFSFNSAFSLSEIVWKEKSSNLIETTMTYSYSFNIEKNETIKIYFKHCTEFNIISKEIKDISFQILNTKNSKLTNFEKYSEISSQILGFIFNIPNNEPNNKTLCQILGFSSVEILGYGIIFRI